MKDLIYQIRLFFTETKRKTSYDKYSESYNMYDYKEIDGTELIVNIRSLSIDEILNKI